MVVLLLMCGCCVVVYRTMFVSQVWCINLCSMCVVRHLLMPCPVYSAGSTQPGDVISIEEHPGDQKKVNMLNMWSSSHSYVAVARRLLLTSCQRKGGRGGRGGGDTPGFIKRFGCGTSTLVS